MVAAEVGHRRTVKHHVEQDSFGRVAAPWLLMRWFDGFRPTVKAIEQHRGTRRQLRIGDIRVDAGGPEASRLAGNFPPFVNTGCINPPQNRIALRE